MPWSLREQLPALSRLVAGSLEVGREGLVSGDGEGPGMGVANAELMRRAREMSESLVFIFKVLLCLTVD